MESQKRAKNVAISGAVLQTVLTAVMLALWLGLGRTSASTMACLFFLAGAPLLWLMTAVLLYCRQLQQREAAELEEISAAKTGAIFEQDSVAVLRPARARLAWMERWVAPIFTLLWAAYNGGAGLLVLRNLLTGPAGELPDGTAKASLLAILLAFAGFLFSRYAMGMGIRSEWRLLRAAGGFLYANVLAIAAVAVALLAAHQGYLQVDAAAGYIIPCVQIILAVELLLNFILDLYRPRMPAEDYRPGFESRLLNFVAEPAAIGHSIAEAINYQFGFEVSKTWFYQLVSKAFVPLVIFAATVLLAMTSVVIVEQGQQCVVLHWGMPQKATLEPGIHFKWPWPIDVARCFDVSTVHEILLGVGGERDPNQRAAAIVQQGTFKGRELYLWTAEHGQREELDFLLAVPPDRASPAGDRQSRLPPVSIIKLVVAVRYVISDPLKFGYRFANAEQILEDQACCQMVQYCASATLDSPVGPETSDRPEAIMTYGRQRAMEELKHRIQATADDMSLGVRITYVGLQSVHPPASAAGAFQDVLKAERKQDLIRYQAEAEANSLLAQVAGDPASALRLALAIRSSEELEALGHLPANPAEFQRALEEYLRAANGDCRSLEEEIQRERLLGAAAGAKDQLLEAQIAHLALLTSLNDPQRRGELPAMQETARATASDLFDQAAGTPASLVAQASSYRWARELVERSRAESFAREMTAYQASPRIFMLDRWLDVWDQVLPKTTKYVLGVDRRKIEIWLNWEREAAVMEGAFDVEKATPAK